MGWHVSHQRGVAVETLVCTHSTKDACHLQDKVEFCAAGNLASPFSRLQSLRAQLRE